MSNILRICILASICRIFMLLCVIIFGHIFQNYDTSSSAILNYFSCDDNIINDEIITTSPYVNLLRTWTVNWDSVFFLRISKCGYEYEQFFAFFPGLPCK